LRTEEKYARALEETAEVGARRKDVREGGVERFADELDWGSVDNECGGAAAAAEETVDASILAELGE